MVNFRPSETFSDFQSCSQTGGQRKRISSLFRFGRDETANGIRQEISSTTDNGVNRPAPLKMNKEIFGFVDTTSTGNAQFLQVEIFE